MSADRACGGTRSPGTRPKRFIPSAKTRTDFFDIEEREPTWLAQGRDSSPLAPEQSSTGQCSHIGIYGISDRRSRDQSGLIFANLTTLPHFTVSSTMSLPKSAGEPGSAVEPNSASRAFILGSARAALISLLSLSTISAGVFFGAPMPVQKLELVAWHEFIHSRDVRECWRARRGGHC